MVSGAGRAGYIDALDERIGHAVERGDTDVRKTIQGIESELEQFHKKHVMPYGDAPEVQMLIGLSQTGAQRAWLGSTDRGTLTPSQKSTAIGIGSGHALALLFAHEDRVKTSAHGVALAAYVIHSTKRHVADCGNFTAIGIVANGYCQYVPYPAIEQMDKIFDHFSDVSELMAETLMGMRSPELWKVAAEDLSTVQTKLMRLAARRLTAKGNIKRWPPLESTKAQ